MKRKTRLIGSMNKIIPDLSRLLRNRRGISLRTDAGRHVRLGDAFRDARDWTAAREEYERALKLNPTLGHIWVQYGHALKEAGNISLALRAYEHAIDRVPNSSDAHLQRGHALKLQGRLDDAARAYATSHRLDPQGRTARRELRGLGYRLDDLPGADQSAPAKFPPALAIPAGDLIPSLLNKGSYASIETLLSQHDLLPDFLNCFDFDFYSEVQGGSYNLLAGEPLRCLVHFCEIGLSEVAAINARDEIDVSFYFEQLNFSIPMTQADVYRHWLNQGVRRKQPPNMTVWLQDEQRLDVRTSAQIDLEYYRASSPELRGLTATQLMERFINGGVLDTGAVTPPDEVSAELFVAIALRACDRGDSQLSSRVLEWLLGYRPDDDHALDAYLNNLLDSKNYFAATLIGRRLLAAGAATRWTYLRLAECLQHLGQFRQAFEVMSEAVVALPQYPQLEFAKHEASAQFYHSCVREYQELSRVGRIRDGQYLIAEYCEIATARLSLEKIDPRPVKSVALFGILDLPQCRSYRINQKIEQLERVGFSVTLFDANTQLSSFLASVVEFQAVIFYRVMLMPDVIRAIQSANSQGLITFYEIDDLLFIPEEYPGRIEGYAGQISAETFAALAMGVPLFAGAMRMCTYAIASTPTLAKAMAPLVTSGRAFVHRNGMGTDHERYLCYEPCPVGSGPVILFYGSGTRAHKEDFKVILEPALIAVCRKYGKRVAVILVGWLPISDALREAAADLTVIEPIFDLHGYWELLRQADINLAVLSPSLNVDSKSEIKWMEAALFGIPSVVSRTATYAEVIKEGETGFMCETAGEWIDTLDRVIRDPELRRFVGRQAQEVVRRDYAVDAMARNLQEIMSQVAPLSSRPLRKILIVNVFYTPQTIGGATRVVHDNVQYLAAKYGDAFLIEVFTCIDGAAVEYSVESYIQDGIRVTGVTRSSLGEAAEPLIDKEMGRIFSRYLTTSKPDLVHFHCIQRLSLAVVLAAQEHNIPYVITAHDAWWISDNQFLIDARGHEQTYDYAEPRKVLSKDGYRSFARMQGLRSALFGAHHVLGVSDAFSALHTRCGVPNVITLANGLSPLPACVRVQSASGRVRLGHVGGMARHKGFFLLKHALMRGGFEHLEIVVVDDSKSKEHEHREVWGATPVRVVGKVPSQEVVKLYAQIDVLMAPSLWTESFGLAAREAQACGCWVVASNRGAIGSDVVEDVNGHVVDVSTIDGLVHALRRIDSDPQRYMRSPPRRPIRMASAQGDDLADLYKRLQPEPLALTGT